MKNFSALPTLGNIGDIVCVNAVLYLCTAANTWTSLVPAITFAGRINADGTVVHLPAGWTCTKTGTGGYEIDHTLGVANFAVVVCEATSFGNTVGINSQDSSKFVVVGYSAVGVSFVDVAFEFILTLY